jgi:DNA helicase-2/ATP-dependent DNA helicase PcrA
MNQIMDPSALAEFDFGPRALGRGVIVSPGQATPEPFAECERVVVSQETLKSPQATADHLHALWVNRQPVVVELEIDPAALKHTLQETDDREPWLVGDTFVFHGQRLHFLVWNNNWDLRTGTPVWWWSKKAAALGAQPSDLADIVLPAGGHAYCDGGPVSPIPQDGDIALVPYTAIEAGHLRPFAQLDAQETPLAPDQERAVHHRGGAARIIAPAGSGKTRVLTERFRHLLQNWSLDPSTVCAVAYNTRAAEEMNNRTGGLNTHIRTLNALGFAIVNGAGGFLRSSLETQQRRMLNERDVRSILQNMVEVPRRMNTDPYAVWIEALSTARLGLQNPEDMESESGDLDGFADVFGRYRDHLDKNGLMDFDEQIYRAIEILLRDPLARQRAQRQCRMLLVDEFQDLTPAHLLLVRLLASPALDIFAVGDDDQVIYGYAGANPEYLVNFGTLFPGAAEHALEVNYRCPPAVITGAGNLLTRNAPRVPKTIRPAPERKSDQNDMRVEQHAGNELAQRAADLIESWIAEGIQPQEIAVLTRVNVTLLPVQVCLQDRNILHTAPVDSALMQRTGISTALAYLRIGTSPTTVRRVDVQATVHRPSRKIARNVVDMMTKRASTSIQDIRRLATHLNGNDASRVATYAADLQRIADTARTGSTERVFDTVRNSIGLGEVMGVLDSSRKEADRSTHADDLAALEAVAHLHANPASFEPWLKDMLNYPGTENGVQLSTVHKVKGREWKRVIVYDASRRLFPHSLATDVAEERRVFHVAITRCSEHVTILANSDEPSPFLGELEAPGEPMAARPKRVGSAKETSKPASTTPQAPAEIGMAIAIPGGIEGTIVEVGETAITVSAGKARVSVSYGTTARIHGKLVEIGPPLDETTQAFVTALKNWRRSAAAEAKVPAYTVLHDAHIEAIAKSRPTSLAELAKCKGIGTSKLERWGDEILAAIDNAQSPAA